MSFFRLFQDLSGLCLLPFFPPVFVFCSSFYLARIVDY